jgi:hypothetical protein
MPLQIGDAYLDEESFDRFKSLGGTTVMGVAGVTFRRDAIQALDGFVNGVVTFEAEPENAFDEDAKKVLINGTHVGYVKRGRPAPQVCYGIVKIQGGRYPCVWLAVS